MNPTEQRREQEMLSNGSNPDSGAATTTDASQSPKEFYERVVRRPDIRRILSRLAR